VFPPEDSPVPAEGGEHGWRSPVFGLRLPAPVIRIVRTTALPSVFAAAIELEPQIRAAEIRLAADRRDCRIEWIGCEAITVEFPERGLPVIS